MEMTPSFTAGQYVGDDLWVSVLDGGPRQYVDLDTAATSSASVAVDARGPGVPPLVRQRPPRRRHPVAAHQRPLRGGTRRSWCASSAATRRRTWPSSRRNTTEAINHARLPAAAEPRTTWSSRRRWSTTPTCCRGRGVRELRYRRVRRSAARSTSPPSRPRWTRHPRPKVLAVSGGSNVTGWLPDLRAIVAAAHAARRPRRRRRRAARAAPPGDITALGVDVIAFSGHKMYAPFGAGALIAPALAVRRPGEPFLVGGGAVQAVSLRRRGLGRRPRPRGRRLAQRPRRRRADRRRRRAAQRRLVARCSPTRSTWFARPGLGAGVRARSAAGWARSPATGCRSRRSTSRACRTGCWPPGWPTSSRSAPVTAASAPTRTWEGCSDSPRPRSTSSTPTCAPAGSTASREPFASARIGRPT